ncbi:hypothetical protein WJX84_010979 [Apatococcus fuscideae]|uniref:Uncharacterized protein n=1 Tax=Apatococcus fuscideae TaxID=2026836 RepID=A0AAW1SR18_9CHLO
MSVLELQLQTPPPGPFSFHDLKWVVISDTQTLGRKDNAVVQTYRVARISWDRRDDFLLGEGTRGTCTFYSKKSERKAPDRLAELVASKTLRKDTFIEYQVRHCNHGPENHTESGNVLLEKQQGQRRAKRARGDGVRLGCQLHFKFARYLHAPNDAIVTWLGPVDHCDKAGSLVHGPGCDATANTRHAVLTHLSEATRDWVRGKLLLGTPHHAILAEHRSKIREQYSDAQAVSDAAIVASLKQRPQVLRDYMLNDKDIDNLAKRLEKLEGRSNLDCQPEQIQPLRSKADMKQRDLASVRRDLLESLHRIDQFTLHVPSKDQLVAHEEALASLKQVEVALASSQAHR